MRRSKPSIARCCLGLAATLISSVAIADDMDASVVIREYAGGDGSCFALAVKGHDLASTPVSRYAVVVDTSASQLGTVRETSLELVNKVLKGLPSNSTAQLFAVDVQCDALTQGLVPADSQQMTQAVQQLALRTPLGTTNLKAALQSLVALANQSAPTSVLYIGDGMASDELVTSADLQDLAIRLTQGGVTIHSAVIGPKTNVDFPATLANLTGGTVAVVKPSKASAAIPGVLAAIKIAPVQVSQVAVDGQPLSLATRQQIYVRSDRHTVLMGLGTLPQFQSLTASTTSQELKFAPADCKRIAGGIGLTTIVSRSLNSNGLDVSVASLPMLNSQCDQLATQIGQYERAEQLLTRRGEHLRARKVRTVLTAMQQAAEELAPPPGDAPVGGAVRQPAFANDGFGPPPAAPIDALAQVADEVRLQTEILIAETNQALDEANRESFERPDYATSVLKDVLETIQTSADISPEIRQELERRVAAALATVQNRRDVDELRQQQLAQERAIEETQQRVIADQLFEENRLGILIDQVRGLLVQARKGDSNAFEDAEAVSRDALDLRPGNGPATQALVMSEALGQLDKAYRLVNLRHDRFLEVLYQVELSHVPFPDEPPIQYPPADVWRALTLTRKPRYESFDLRQEKPVEKWLRQMLDKPVPLLDYPGDTPLSEILDQLATHFNQTYGELEGKPLRMTIWPDYPELEIDGITTLEDVTVRDITFEGITLRNALDLIFERTTDPALTYIITREVFMITTLAKAESDDNLVTRVYPVADLVIPPVQLGGGQQGAGGGGGALGGGGAGAGGGGGGQAGGFGGGGGAGFSVPAEIFDVLKDAGDGITNQTVKKK